MGDASGGKKPPPRWQQWLAVFVGVIAASNLVIYAGIGRGRLLLNPGERLGYAMGSGLGLGLGISLVLWLLMLRRAPRSMTAIAFALVTLSGTLATHYFMPR